MSRIDHIGIAVRNINESKLFYEESLGLNLISEEIIDNQKVKTAIFECGESRIELIEPTDDLSPISKFLNIKGSGIHHIAIQVNDITNKLKVLKEQGVQLIDSAPKLGAGGHKIAFVHPKSAGGVLIELVEK